MCDMKNKKFTYQLKNQPGASPLFNIISEFELVEINDGEFKT
jgi:hypothetical protein